MLSKETKKKIDDARDILVGQLPLPSDQVELITIALIYKFMDDQDEDQRQLGFDEAFFSGDLKQYSWQRLMSNEIDADERVNVFTKGIEEIQKAPHIPLLFREIFKNTFLKFRDGRTLHLFLGVINGFSYDHSEELGNAFEYLLMSMGAQGENGQFRTPRNIIDFIVEVVDPDKGDTILDPACGTGGFLLSAYKHILRKYTTDREHYRITLNNEEIEGIPVNWGDKLTTQDLKQLGVSIEGYDITPQMTRLAKVNLYLHQFKSPRIHEYDTLTSEGRWKDKYDCILANPPFMTPKGGVSTHSKFRIRATKAEVLFSDYILEHLTPDGMAGFIVPEGIIFQNSDDYVELRKWLVNGAGLWAVVSLPAQIFQPYSGVKTSILFIDRKIARSRDEIILVKVESDGYTLNTNRAPTARNDLPEALNLLTIGKKSLDELRDYLEKNGGKQDMPKALIKPRSEFARLDAYKAQSAAFSLIRKQHEKCLAAEDEIKLLPPADQEGLSEKEKKTRIRLQGNLNKLAAEFSKTTGTAYTKIPPPLTGGGQGVGEGASGSTSANVTPSPTLPRQGGGSESPLQSYFDDNLKEAVIAYGVDGTKVGGLTPHLRDYLDGQREYSLSFEKYTDGSGLFLDSKHEMVLLADACERVTDVIDPLSCTGKISYIGLENIEANSGSLVGEITSQFESIKSLKAKFKENDILYGKLRPNLNKVHLVNFPGICSTDILVFRAKTNANARYLSLILRSQQFNSEVLKGLKGAQLPRVSANHLFNLEIPLPSLEIQEQIVAEIETSQKILDGCNLIIENYKPIFEINAEWPVVKLHSICETITDGDHMPPPKSEVGVPFVTITNIKIGYGIDFSNTYFVPKDYYAAIKEHRKPKQGDILYTVTGSFGIPVLIDFDREFCFQRHIGLIKPASSVSNSYLYFYLQTPDAFDQACKAATGVAQKTVSLSSLRNFSVPLPPLETQQKIVAELEQDMSVVAGAKRLKAKMEANIRATIGRVWGET